MTLDFFITVKTLAMTKSFSKTATALHISQSTVSMRIAELERRIGKKLFLRNNHEVILTEAGTLFLSLAEQITSTFDKEMSKLTSIDLFEDRIIIGNVNSALPNFLKPIYQDFLKSYPQISVKAITNHSSHLLQMLENNEIDLAISYQAPRSSKYVSYIVLEESFCLVASPDSTLSQKGYLSAANLPQEKIILHSWGGAFNEWLYQLIPENRWFSAVISSPSFVLSLVEAGLGAAFLTESTIQNAVNAKRVNIIPFIGNPQPPLWYTYLITTPKQLARSSIRQWLSIMERHGLLWQEKNIHT